MTTMTRGRDRGRGYDDDDQRPTGRDRARGYEGDERRPMGRDRDREYDEEQRTMSRDSNGRYEDDKRRAGTEIDITTRARGYEADERRPMGRDRDREYDEEQRTMSRDSNGRYEDDKRRAGTEVDITTRARGYEADERRPMGRDRDRVYDEEQRTMSRDSNGRYEDDKRRAGTEIDITTRARGYEADERRPMGRDRDREYDEEQRTMSRDSDGRYEDDKRRPMGGGRGWGGRGRGGDRDDDKPVAPPLYSILKATVHSIRPFGIFVQMEGYRNHGLVHLSQVSDHEVTNRDDSEEAKVKALSSVASEGEQVWVKVISVNVEENGKPKIGCSMKYVGQGDGEDLDPNNIQAEKQQSRPAWKEPQKFKLDAVLNVQCERCGGHGHLKKECYSSGEKTYKLLSDDEDADLTVQKPTKSEDRLPRQSSKRMLPPMAVVGMSKHLLATGSVGRGRAVVQPAWMKHGVGVGGPAPPEADPEPKQISALPGKLETVEDALAVIAMLKEEKHRRKEERHKKKEKRSKSRDEKHKSKKEERHKSRDEKDKRKKRKHRDEEDRKERYSTRKKHRDERSS